MSWRHLLGHWGHYEGPLVKQEWDIRWEQNWGGGEKHLPFHCVLLLFMQLVALTSTDVTIISLRSINIKAGKRQTNVTWLSQSSFPIIMTYTTSAHSPLLAAGAQSSLVSARKSREKSGRELIMDRTKQYSPIQANCQKKHQVLWTLLDALIPFLSPPPPYYCPAKDKNRGILPCCLGILAVTTAAGHVTTKKEIKWQINFSPNNRQTFTKSIL